MERESECRLKRQEVIFCEEYITCYNQTRAAIRAGYPAKSAAKRGCELMKRADINECINRLQADRSARLCIRADYVMTETLELLEKCKGVNPVMRWNYETHQMENTGEYSFDSRGAIKCLELLAKMTGTDRQVTGEVDPAVVAEVEGMVLDDA